MIEKKQLWFEWIGIISLVLFIISLSITLTINFRALYIFDIDHLNILDQTFLSKSELLENFDQLMNYLNNPLNHTLKLSDFPMSSNGRFHFYEVKKLFILCYTFLIVTLLPSIFTLIYLKKNNRLWRLIRPFEWGMFLPIFFATLMATGFDRFFILFHSIFFNNDDWLFDPATDPIINVLPEEYFLHCFIVFFILLELFFLSGIVAGKYELKRYRMK